MADHLFKCLHCGGAPLDRGEDGYRCPRCAAVFAIHFGVPLFLKDVRVSPSGCAIPDDIAREILKIHSVSESEDRVRGVQDILAHNYHLPDLSLAAENNYFLNRVPLPEHLKRPPPAADPGAAPVNHDVHYRIVGHLLPDALPAGVTLTRNVRLRNTGASVISSGGPNPVQLSYHWRTPAGAVVQFDGDRTPLPIDLLPGRAIAVPALIRTPAAPGPHVLQLTMVHEGHRWLDDDSCGVGVDVVAEVRQPVPAHWAERAAENYNYTDDHNEARRLVHEAVRRRGPGMRILEVGGCCNPMARGLDAEIYSVDIDIQTSQLGQLSVLDPSERLQFLAADVNNLPFNDHTFDCVVMFSALHHFADPQEVLAKFKRLLRKDGFLAVMCEPVGCYVHGQVGPELANELRQGINEQVFTREEYHLMFQRAGLYTSSALIDGGSFKAFLWADPEAACRAAAAAPQAAAQGDGPEQAKRRRRPFLSRVVRRLIAPQAGPGASPVKGGLLPGRRSRLGRGLALREEGLAVDTFDGGG